MPTACGVVSVATQHVDALEARLCGGAEAPACVACGSPANLELHAACRRGRCVTVDLEVDATSACATDDECVARPAFCCAPCGLGGPYVALRKDAAAQYTQEICGKVKCASCATPPTPPRAVCDPRTKHCAVAP
jgi:hypothetical protein